MEHFDELNAWGAPPFLAHAVPMLWQPNESTGERFVAVVALRYEAPLLGGVSTHIAFRQQQLKAMLGAKRAASAYGILEHVAHFVHQQLQDGLSLAELSAPFDGFVAGKEARVRGYSKTQVIDTAVRTLSAFGTRDTYVDELETVQRNTVPTSRFLRSVRSVFSREESDRRARFNRKVEWPGAPEITLDYAHNQHLVQVTSLPQSAPHLLALQKEAESKMFELDIAATLLRNSAPAQPSILVNTGALADSLSREAEAVARELLERLRFMSAQKKMSLIEARDPVEGARILDELDDHARIDTRSTVLFSI
ncbi:hypothetical protein ACNRBS_00455 [Ralstonia pseudosolanacearum]|uniref:hypothetical protein n=1 Tax=Ralstonia pseudosolanacearum TaxID=1310165 RepID=UPI003AAF8292